MYTNFPPQSLTREGEKVRHTVSNRKVGHLNSRDKVSMWLNSKMDEDEWSEQFDTGHQQFSRTNERHA